MIRIFIPSSAPYDSVHVEYAETVQLTAEELSRERIRGGRWVYYKVYEMKEEKLKEKGGMGVDVCVVHGE